MTSVISLASRQNVRVYPLRWRGVEPRWPEMPSLLGFKYTRPRKWWEYKPATGRQLDRLFAYGLTPAPDERRRRPIPDGFPESMRATLSKAPPPPVRLTLAKAAFLIDVCIGLDRKYGSDPLPASDRQKRLLARYGYLADGLTREGASRVISHIHAVERGAS